MLKPKKDSFYPTNNRYKSDLYQWCFFSFFFKWHLQQYIKICTNGFGICFRSPNLLPHLWDLESCGDPVWELSAYDKYLY